METEKKPQAKNRWTPPALVILVRSKPEEVVLSTCKGGQNQNTAPGQNHTGCQQLFPCGTCDGVALS